MIRTAAAHGLNTVVAGLCEPGRPKRHATENTHQKFNCFTGANVRTVRLARRWLALLQLAATIITWRSTSHQLISP